MNIKEVCNGQIYLVEVKGTEMLESVKGIGETAILKVSGKDTKENLVYGTVRLGYRFVPAVVDSSKLIKKTYDSWTVEP